MQENFITAIQCIENFKKIGINITESYFSRSKSKGYFIVHSIKKSKRDWYIFDEVVRAYFKFSPPGNIHEKKIKDAYFQRQETLKSIAIEWGKLYSPKEIIFENFNIENLWISAQNDLAEIKAKEGKGQKIDDDTKILIFLKSTLTEDEHIEHFKKNVSFVNVMNESGHSLLEKVTDDLSEVYSDFEESKFLLHILKSANSWIITPEQVANNFNVTLIENIDAIEATND